MNHFCITIGLVLFTAAAAWADDPASQPAKRQIAIITVEGSLPENAGQGGLLGEIHVSLSEVIAHIDQAAQDESVGSLLLRLREAEIGQGKVQELRSAIQRVRKAGKRVVADLRSGSSNDYLVAAACDEIFMPESGTLMLAGVRAEVMYFKGLFDKLAIQADMLQVGSFKGAAEPYTRQEMSAEYRQQMERLLDDIFEQMVATIAADRHQTVDQVRNRIDQGLLTATQAQQAGLIDFVAYESEIVKRLRSELRADKVELVEDYGKKKIENDFSGPMGMFNLMNALLGGSTKGRNSQNRKLALIYAVGTITDGESGVSLLGGQTLGGDTVVKAIRQAQEDSSVVAIVVRVDSPGGSALASDLIWREIQNVEKPILASMGDTAASGGYYISMGCDRIFAEPGTLTGSIGVVGGKISYQGLLDRVGVTTTVISRGKNSGILSSDRFTDSEREAWQSMMQETYRLFTTKAAAGRKMSVDQLEPLAGGRVWTGRQAKALGLVDELGTLRETIAAAKQAAGIPESEKLELIVLPEPRTLFEQLMSGKAGTATHTQQALERWSSPLRGAIEFEQLFERLLERPALLLPYQIRIR